MNVVVIGTGIAGLGAAIALATKGHQVTVLEATSKLQAIGGIIIMQPNANRILDQWGIYKTFLRICREQPCDLVQRRYTGEVLSRRTDAMQTYGYPYALDSFIPSIILTRCQIVECPPRRLSESPLRSSGGTRG